MLIVLVVLWLGSVMALQMLPVLWRAQRFAVPLSPYTPAAGMFLNLHLIGARPTTKCDISETTSQGLCVAKPTQSQQITGSLDWQAYARFGGWLVISILVYVCYGMHMADAHDTKMAAT